MSDARKTAVVEAASQILQPLTSLLLQAGLGIGDFISLAKLALVQSSARNAGKGDRLTASRIATETGLHLREVVQLLEEKPRPIAPQKRGRVRAERVLYGWWTDPEFHDEFGKPAALWMRSSKNRTTPSLVALVQRHSGTSRAKSILDELLRCGAVRQQADGRYRAVRKTCVNIDWDKGAVAELGLQVRLHFEALLQNVQDPVSSPQLARLRLSGPIDALQMRVLLRDLRAEGERFLETANDRLSHSRYAAVPDADDARQLAVLVQVIEGPFRTPSAPKSRPPAGRRPRKRPSGTE